MSDDYNRPILEEYEFKIYDSQMNLKGVVRDKMEYQVYYDAPRDPATASPTEKEQINLYGPYHREVAVARCQITPVLTRNFFNTDDKLEIMVGMSVQTTYYVNNNYNKVYQLDGETYTATDFEGNTQTYSKLLKNIPAQLGDAYCKLDKNGREMAYMTFMADYEPEEDIEIPDMTAPLAAASGDEGEDDDDPSSTFIPGFWEQYCSYAHDMVMYRGVREGETDIQKIWDAHIPLSKLPGDMASTPFMMTFERNGKLHLMKQYYKDTFYNRYDSPIDDMTMRENNSLVIEIYEINSDGNGFTLIQNTEVPISLTPSSGDNKILYSYFSAGDFRYREDINFTDYNTGGKAAFFITKRDYLAGQDDSYLMSYYLYNDKGELIKTLFENSESHFSMSDIPGFEPQELFITRDSMGDYLFHFYDLKSLKEVLTLNWWYQIDPDSDPDRMSANIDRVEFGDTYKYANELRYPTQDDDGNDIGRVLWFNRDGSFDRIDEINMGSGVYYAQFYIERQTLHPDYYFVDGPNEYMMLVKRGTQSDGQVEELLVAQARSAANPDGMTLLSDGPDERGSIGKVFTYSYGGKPILIVTKSSVSGPLYWDIYSLPFTSAGDVGVESVIGGDGDSLVFSGSSIIAEDADIEVFDISGLRVAQGSGCIDVSSLGSGIYVVRANGKTVKFGIR